MDFSVSNIVDLISVYGLKLLGAAPIFLLGKWLVKLASKAVHALMLKSKVEETLAAFVGNITYFAGLAFVVIAALGQMGIQTTSIAAVLGAAGLAIALSLQGSLGNLASGVMIIGTRPFKIGDMVEVAGKTGKVLEINIFATELKDADGKRVIIPNGKITGDIIVNHTA